MEYSIGVSDKTGFLGGLSMSWIQDKDNYQSYFTVGSIGVAGSVGYGRKHYFFKVKYLSGYISSTGFGYYILPLSENGDLFTGLGLSGNLGIDFSPIKWKENELKFHIGLLASCDPLRSENLIVPGEGGPSFLMPSFNIKVVYF